MKYRTIDSRGLMVESVNKIEKSIFVLIVVGIVVASAVSGRHCMARGVETTLVKLLDCSGGGAATWDFSSAGEVERIKQSADGKIIALSFEYYKQGDIRLPTQYITVDAIGKTVNTISEARFEGFNNSCNSQVLECRPEIEQFIKEYYKPHPGILGGLVQYYVESWCLSPNRDKVAFIIEGNDGHRYFNPTIYTADIAGNDMTKIDSSPVKMCKDMIWLSNNELVYSKDNILCKATIEGKD